MRNVLVLFSILIGCWTMADPVKSVLSARHLAFGGEETTIWENPYVTNGLVAMWDGEWNVSGGRHSASSSIWVDIVGGVELRVVRGTWTANGFSWIPNNQSQAISTTIPDGLKDVISSNYVTVEAVVVPQAKTSGCYDICNTMFRIYNAGNTDVLNYFKIKSGPLYIESYVALGIPISLTAVVFPPKNIWWVINGNIVSSATNYSQPTPNNTIELYSKGIVHSVRIYSRALSAKEIAYNYAIDQMRFGLP